MRNTLIITATILLAFMFILSTLNAHLMCQSLGIKFRDANKAYQDAKKAHAESGF